jgi:hypothetical protein
MVPIRVRREDDKVLRVRLLYPGELGYASWHRPDVPFPDGPLIAYRDQAHKDYSGGAVAMQFDGALILRRSLAQAPLGDALRAGDALFRDVVLAAPTAGNKPRKFKQALEDDWVMVETRRRFPIDRDRHPPACFEPADSPHAALVEAWEIPPVREPRASMFRVGELPIDLFVDEPLFAKLQAVFGSALEEGLSSPTLTLLESQVDCPPIGPSADEARAAALAYYALYGGETSPSARAAALKSPIYSYWLARVVDGEPRDDTRLGACAHPYYALLYARDIDRGPRDDTRRAASASGDSNFEYMRDVDRGAHATTRAAELERGYNPAGDYELEAPRVAERWGKATAAGQPARAEWQVAAWGKSGRAEVAVAVEGAPQAFYEWELSLARAPRAVLTARDPANHAGLRKRAPKIVALERSRFGDLILRRSLVEPILGDLGPDELVLHPVRLVDKAGLIDDDFVLLDVRAVVPLDRRAARATFRRPDRPSASFVLAVQSYAWSEERRPRPRIFRVGEAPRCIVVEAELLEQLSRATKKAVVALADHAGIDPSSPMSSSLDGLPEPDGDDAAEESFWTLYRGAGDAADRARVLASPHYAYWLARLVDKKPAEDTRRAACKHPFYATEYALFVDGAERPDTRAAAEGHWLTAIHYLHHVSLALWPGAERTLRAAGYGDDELVDDPAELRAFYRSSIKEA